MKNKIILYTTHCPMCRQLERQLKLKGLEFEECEDVELMKEKGLMHVPALQVNDGEIMDFTAAIKWLRSDE